MKKRLITLMAIALLSTPLLLACGTIPPEGSSSSQSSTPESSSSAETSTPSSETTSSSQTSSESSSSSETSSSETTSSSEASSSEASSSEASSSESSSSSSETSSEESSSSSETSSEETNSSSSESSQETADFNYNILYVKGNLREPILNGTDILDDKQQKVGEEYSFTATLNVGDTFNFARLEDQTYTVDEWQLGDEANKNAFTMQQLSAERAKTEGENKASDAKCLVAGSYTMYVKSYKDYIKVWASPLPGTSVPTEGYGIEITQVTGGLRYVVFNPTDEYDGFKQYLGDDVELHSGDTFKLCDFTNNARWSLTNIEDGGQGKKFTASSEKITCNADGVYDIYLKLKSGEDRIYIGNSEGK